MQKRNPRTKEYEPYSIPTDHNCPIYTNSMEELINCASCLGILHFGSAYSSQVIHNNLWFGYPVCEDCYYKEEK